MQILELMLHFFFFLLCDLQPRLDESLSDEEENHYKVPKGVVSHQAKTCMHVRARS